MLPEQVGVAAEHLLVHVLDLVLEALGETRGLAAVVVRVLRGGFDSWERRSRGELVVNEDLGILDLAVDPSLDVLDVDGCWEVDGVAFGVDPGVCCSGIGWLANLTP